MTRNMTEDQVRKQADRILDMEHRPNTTSGTGQITSFKQLGFKGFKGAPDGWYLPDNTNDVAVVFEFKSTSHTLNQTVETELLRNIRVFNSRYPKTVGVMHNGDQTRVYKNGVEYNKPGADTLQNIDFYLHLFDDDHIDKERIYELTARINNSLHIDFGIRNLYQRMIFTACALVVQRYNGKLAGLKGQDYATLHGSIHSALKKSLEDDSNQNNKIDILLEEYEDIRMNITDNQNAIDEFIDNVCEISKCINSNEWRGEDVMGIFFNEFNRYKAKPTDGQVFTPEHITDFMYRIIEVDQNDRVLDAACGSGGFLVKAMANMIRQAGGMETRKATRIKSEQLYGIEKDREIFSLACANMMIHKDGKSNLEQLDSTSTKAAEWIAGKDITKVLMNPPFESKYGCMDIVENVLDSVLAHTLCAIILPDKKLEKTSRRKVGRLLRHHRLLKIIKLPEDLFPNLGVTTSIFVFETGIPQDGEEIFACYMQSDGLVTVKNKGRHDVHDRWTDIEEHWVNVIRRQSGDDSCQWVKPEEHLSYQLPAKPFEITTEEFRRTAMDWLMFQRGIDEQSLRSQVLDAVLYDSSTMSTDDGVSIKVNMGGER